MKNERNNDNRLPTPKRNIHIARVINGIFISLFAFIGVLFIILVVQLVKSINPKIWGVLGIIVMVYLLGLLKEKIKKDFGAHTYNNNKK